jgi:hypothetical protein
MSKMMTDGNEALVQTADDVEDKCAVGDMLAKVANGVSRALEVTTV